MCAGVLRAIVSGCLPAGGGVPVASACGAWAQREKRRGGASQPGQGQRSACVYGGGWGVGGGGWGGGVCGAWRVRAGCERAGRVCAGMRALRRVRPWLWWRGVGAETQLGKGQCSVCVGRGMRERWGGGVRVGPRCVRGLGCLWAGGVCVALGAGGVCVSTHLVCGQRQRRWGESQPGQGQRSVCVCVCVCVGGGGLEAGEGSSVWCAVCRVCGRVANQLGGCVCVWGPDVCVRGVQAGCACGYACGV